jgi:endonuclease YncB( thermonuclease family)
MIFELREYKMRKTIFLALIVFALCFFTKKPIDVISGRVKIIADGDTIIVLNANNEQKLVRLYGIDAPEKNQPYGEASRKHLSDMVAGLDIDVSVYDIDRYGRSVGRIKINNTDVNRAMIEAGYAWVYREYCKISKCSEWERLEQEAKVAKRGLWQKPNPIYPAEWRRRTVKHQRDNGI